MALGGNITPSTCEQRTDQTRDTYTALYTYKVREARPKHGYREQLDRNILPRGGSPSDCNSPNYDTR